MTDRERRRRRGEPSGGSPSRRTDRVRRPVFESTESSDDSTASSPDVRRSPRLRPAPVRSWASRALGRLTTRRAALLALVVCALALSIAVPLHTYLSQQDELRSQAQQQQALRAQESQLTQREAQLADPAQVEAEARTRLHFVMPGETPYVVQLPGGTPSTGRGSATSPSGGPASSWYQKLWNSIVGSH